jgi:flagellar basal-body rod protein FlgC
MDLRQTLHIGSSGLTAQRLKMNVIAENLAHAQTTRTPEGGPYRRKMVVLEAISPERFEVALQKKQADYDEVHEAGMAVEVSEIVASQENFRLVHNPAHPDADPQTGFVAMPNVDPLTEMADMLVARRAYDAMATVISNTKGMIMKALEIGK